MFARLSTSVYDDSCVCVCVGGGGGGGMRANTP